MHQGPCQRSSEARVASNHWARTKSYPYQGLGCCQEAEYDVPQRATGTPSSRKITFLVRGQPSSIYRQTCIESLWDDALVAELVVAIGNSHSWVCGRRYLFLSLRDLVHPLLVLCSLIVGGLVLLAYLWIACVHRPCGIPEAKVEREIREKVIKEWETPASAEHHEV